MTGAILADDLTGACDAAARAACAGWRVTVELDRDKPDSDADILAVSTASRSLSAAQACEAATAAAQALMLRRPPVFYKKIDSTLRGPWREEVLAVARAIGSARIILCPAFPACGRAVRQGRVYVDGEPGPELSLDGATVLDAESEDDLARIAGLFRAGTSLLWVGSGGLARYIFGERRQPALPLPGARRWTVLVGSNHPRTLEQVQWLKPRLRPSQVLLDSLPAAEQVSADTGFFVAGGDTAFRLLRLLGAEAVEICGEVEPGVAVGRLRGGRAGGATLVTKAGGFGDRGTMARVLEKLTTP